MTEALHPRYTPGGNLYFDETGQYDQSEYWRHVALNRDRLDSSLRDHTPDATSLGTQNLDEVLDPDTYIQLSTSNITSQRNYPPISGDTPKGGTLFVTKVFQVRTQMYVADQAGEIWVRTHQSGGWRDWQKVGGEDLDLLSQSLDDTHLDTVIDPGTYIQMSTSNVSVANGYPSISGQIKGGSLFVTRIFDINTQIYFADQAGEIFLRSRQSGGWRDWQKVGGTSPSYDGGLLVLDMEVTGEWTTTDRGYAYLEALSNHAMLTKITVGQSVDGRPIEAVIIGDSTKPAVLINAGAHGNEVGPPEAAWLWIRDSLKQKTLMHMDMCVIVLPLMNPDNRLAIRNNRNNVDLNRDYIARSQPETQALLSIVDDYNVVAAVDTHNFGFPREVSLQEASHGPVAVQEKSQELYDAVFAAMENDGQPVRRYFPDTTEASFHNGLSVVDGIPAILFEIPCGGYMEPTFDYYYPSPAWQAHVGAIGFDAITHYVWEHLEEFDAIKNG